MNSWKTLQIHRFQNGLQQNKVVLYIYEFFITPKYIREFRTIFIRLILLIWKAELHRKEGWWRDREWVFYPLVPFPQQPQQLVLGLAEARSQEHHLGVLCGCRGPNTWNIPWYLTRKLGKELGWKGSNDNVPHLWNSLLCTSHCSSKNFTWINFQKCLKERYYEYDSYLFFIQEED